MWGCRSPDYEEAVEFCYQIRRGALCGGRNLFVLPGNHDIQWLDESTGRVTTYTREKAEAAYREFRLKVMKTSSDGGASGLGFLHFDATRQVALVGLNSTRWESPQLRGAGYVGFDQVYAQLEDSDLARRIHQQAGKVQVVAFLHHNIMTTCDHAPGPGNGWSAQPCADSIQLCAALRHYGVNLVLHGHIHSRAEWPGHNPTIASDWMPGPKPAIDIRAVGSPSVRAEYVVGDHHFQLVEMIPSHSQYVVHEWTASPSSTALNGLRPWARQTSVTRVSERFLPESHYLPERQKERAERARYCALAAGVWEDWLLMESLAGGEEEAYELVRRRVVSWSHSAARHNDAASQIVDLKAAGELDQRLRAAITTFRAASPGPEDLAMGRRLRGDIYASLQSQWRRVLNGNDPGAADLTMRLVTEILEQVEEEPRND